MNPPSDPNNHDVLITPRDVYDAVSSVQKDVAEMKGSLALLTQHHSIASSVDVDHETRIRRLEQWKYAIPTTFVLAFFASLASILVAILKVIG